MVVCRDSIGAQGSTRSAAMDDRPFAAFSHPERYRLHQPAAIGRPVARNDIQMDAVQAIGTVVAVLGPGAGNDDRHTALAAFELVGLDRRSRL